MSMEVDLLVDGRYRLVSLIGGGGMGQVWRARDEVLKRDVAVKEVVPPAGLTVQERSDVVRRTLREARAAARVTHPGAVRVYDVLSGGDFPLIVMEYVPARSLAQILTEDGPLDPEQVAGIGLGVLRALRAAHRVGVLHRDVKPANVLISTDGRAVLTDFGIATLEGDPAVTRTGMILGSPAYTAPERARSLPIGPAADLWSLGATLYAAVEGRPPFERDTAIATLTAAITEDLTPPARAGALWPVIEGLLRRDPAERMSAAEADRLLMLGRAAAAAATPRSIRPPRASARVRPPSPRTPPPPPQIPPPAPATPPPAAQEQAPSDDAPATPARDETPSPGITPAAAQEQTPSEDAPATPARDETPSAGTPATEVPEQEPSTNTRTAVAAQEQEPPAETRTAVAAQEQEPSTDTRTAVAAQEQPPGARTSPAPESARSTRDATATPATAPAISAAASAESATAVSATAVSVPVTPGSTVAEVPPSTVRRWWRRGLIAGAVVAVLVIALVLTLRPDTKQGARGPGPTGTTAGSAPTGSAPAGGAAPGTQAPSTASPSPTSGGVPPGYRLYQDPSGFSIAIPVGWTVQRQGQGASATWPLVYFRDPNSARYLMVDQTDHPRPNPVADWTAQESSRKGGWPGYQRIRIAAVDYHRAAADWEFTYDGQGGRMHVINRGVVTSDNQAYGLFWEAPDAQWADNLTMWDIFTRTLQPRQ